MHKTLVLFNKKTLENTEGAIKKKNNPEKLATQGTQDEEHNTICVGHHYTQTNTNNVNKTCVILQTTGAKTNRTSFLCGNRNVHHNTELRTYTLNRTTRKTKKMSNTDPTKKPGVNSCVEKGKQFLILIRHQPYKSPVKCLAIIDERTHLRKK